MKLYNRLYYTFYSNDKKTIFFLSKRLSGSDAARQLGIHIHAAQRWVKFYCKDPEGIFEKKKSGRRRILGEWYKV